MNCPKCGYELSNEAKFCPNCGQKVFKKLFCRECGEILPEGAKFCEKCGAPVDLVDPSEGLLNESENDASHAEEMAHFEANKELSKDQIAEKNCYDNNAAASEIDHSDTADDNKSNIDSNLNDVKKDFNASFSDVGKKKKQQSNQSKFKELLNKGKVTFLDVWSRSDLYTRALIVLSILLFLPVPIALFSGKFLNLILSFVFFAATVVLFLIHKGHIKVEDQNIKRYILIGVFVCTLVNTYLIFKPASNNSSSTNTFIKTPLSAQECIGMMDRDIKELFESAGFDHISYEDINDLDLTEKDRKGVVEAVSVAGTSDFEKNKKFSSSSKVTIKRHAMKLKSAPITSEAAKTVDPEELKAIFEADGWEVYSVEEVFDLDPDSTENEFENTVHINWTTEFDETEKFPIDNSVKIVTHRPYEKKHVSITINVVSNPILKSYAMNLSFNNEEKMIEGDGENLFEYNLKPDKYKILLVSSESSSTKGEINIAIEDDSEYHFNIYRTSREIVLIDDAEQKDEEGKTIIKMPLSSSYFYSENYHDVEQLLGKLGFTNIECNPVYDIVYGVTEEESIKEISINGESSFSKGDTFNPEDQVSITYHLKEDDDPNKPAEEEKENEENSGTAEQPSDSDNETMSRSEFIEYLKVLVKQYETDDTKISVSTTFGDIELIFKQKGMHDLVALAKAGDKQALAAWNDFVESTRQMSEALAIGSINVGLNEPVFVNIVDDEAWLFPDLYATCSCGIVQWDVVNGIDLTSN